jgi:hypothetical protein
MIALGCPYRYYRLFIEGYDEPDSDAATQGTILHAARAGYVSQLWRICKHRRKLGQELLRRSPTIFQRALATVMSKYKLTEYEQEQCEALGARFCEAFQLDTGADNHIVERRLYTTYRGYSVEGTPDHVAIYDGGRRAKVIDAKFGHVRVDFETAQHNRQLRLYAWIWFQNHPECQEIDIEIEAPRFGGMKDSHPGTVTRDTLSDVEERLDRKIAELEGCISTSSWLATPDGDACKYCTLHCPLTVSVIIRLLSRALTIHHPIKRRRK